MAMLQLDGIEARCDAGGSVGVTGEEDVLGQFSGAESDVVLPFTGGDRDPAIRRVFDAGIRVRQDRSLARFAVPQARNSAEDSPAFSRASSRVRRAWIVLSRARRRRRRRSTPGAWHADGREQRSQGGPQAGREAGGEPVRQAPADGAPAEHRDQQRRRGEAHEGAQAEGPGRAVAGERRRGRRDVGRRWARRAVPSGRGRGLGPGVGRGGDAAGEVEGEPASTRPAGSATTRSGPPGVDSTRPVTLMASPGSTRARRSAAGPRRTTVPTAVPSSSRNPSGSSSVTRPPMRTV